MKKLICIELVPHTPVCENFEYYLNRVEQLCEELNIICKRRCNIVFIDGSYVKIAQDEYHAHLIASLDVSDAKMSVLADALVSI